MAANTLLSTKLYVPRTNRELVHRPRLIERLNAGLHRRLTLISAPAGFGKTTLAQRQECTSLMCAEFTLTAPLIRAILLQSLGKSDEG